MSSMDESLVAGHYGGNNLKSQILDAISKSNLDLKRLEPADLGPIDEFHMGGRTATAEIVGRTGLTSNDRVLDIGCGLGGLVRYLASEVGCRATGLDLTPEYVGIAKELTKLTGLSDRAGFVIGSALSLPFDDEVFDAALTFHAGMNIADRETKYYEVARVLRPGGKLVIYDVLKGSKPGMLFPVPWAETKETSYLVTVDELNDLLLSAGFSILNIEDRTPLVLDHHRQKVAEMSDSNPTPALGVHLLQGNNAKEKSHNMIEMAKSGQIALGVFIVQKTE